MSSSIAVSSFVSSSRSFSSSLLVPFLRSLLNFVRSSSRLLDLLSFFDVGITLSSSESMSSIFDGFSSTAFSFLDSGTTSFSAVEEAVFSAFCSMSLSFSCGFSAFSVFSSA